MSTGTSKKIYKTKKRMKELEDAMIGLCLTQEGLQQGDFSEQNNLYNALKRLSLAQKALGLRTQEDDDQLKKTIEYVKLEHQKDAVDLNNTLLFCGDETVEELRGIAKDNIKLG